MSKGAGALQPLSGPSLWAAVVLLGLSNFMVVVDTTITNVSVPHIAGSLAVAPAQGTWVITSYAVAEAIVVPLTGWLVQRFGGLKVFVTAMAGFGVFSVACAMAPSFGWLVAFRVLQGLCGGPIMPTSQTLLLQCFPRERTSQALAVWSMTTVAAPVAGPTLGGLISDTVGWPWIFLINIPVVVAVILGAGTLLAGRDQPGKRVRVDYVGLILLILWVGSLQLMLDKGKELEWFASPTIVALAIVAAIGFVCFLIWELTEENPIVNLKVFRHRGFVVGVLLIGLVFGAFFASAVLVPLWLQTTLGFTASWAGLAAGFNGILAVALSPLVARLVDRYDMRILITIGILGLGGVAFWRAQFTTDVTFGLVALTYFVQGGVLQFFFLPAMRMAMIAPPPEELASAAGLATFIRTTAGAFATSIMTTGWEHTASAKRSELVAHLNDVPGAIDILHSRGLSLEQARAQIERLVEQQASTLAAEHTFMIAAAVFLGSALITWFAPKTLMKPIGGQGH